MSLLSPMADAHEEAVAGEEEGDGAAAGGGDRGAAAGVEEDRDGEDLLERDTRWVTGHFFTFANAQPRPCLRPSRASSRPGSWGLTASPRSSMTWLCVWSFHSKLGCMMSSMSAR